MKNKQEILEKAIQKAIDGGWDRNFYNSTLWSPSELAKYIVDAPMMRLNNLIFNHDFAKALWGEATHWYEHEGMLVPWDGWQYHLQQMAIAENTIRYLGDNI